MPLTKPLFIIVGVVLIVLAYIIPYTLLYRVSSLELYIFWILLTIVGLALSITYLRRGGVK